MDINTIIDKIVEANTRLFNFWSRSHGWAPNYAADLMSASRLDRQVSLSKALRMKNSRLFPLNSLPLRLQKP